MPLTVTIQSWSHWPGNSAYTFESPMVVPSMAPPTTVHVADSDETMTAALATLLGCCGITVRTATTGDRLLLDLSGTSGDNSCLLLAERLEDGTRVTLRRMRPEDAAMEQAFMTSLSDRSRYLRVFSGLKQLPPFMLRELTNPRFPASYALIATVREEGGGRQIGVARYAPTDEPGSAEFAVVIADEWRGRGIASQLMRGITVAAPLAGLSQLEGLVLAENRPMLALAASLGFSEKPYPEVKPLGVRPY